MDGSSQQSGLGFQNLLDPSPDCSFSFPISGGTCLHLPLRAVMWMERDCMEAPCHGIST